MTRFMLFLAILCLSPLWIMSAHALAVRLGKEKHRGQMLALAASLAASVPAGAAIWLVYLRSLSGPPLWGALVYAAAAYVLLAYSYFHLFNMSETARRVRLLVELDERGRVPLDELASFYGTGEVLGRRVDRLVSLRQAAVEGGRMVLVSRTLYVAARAVDWWARVLGLPSLRSLHVRSRRGR